MVGLPGTVEREPGTIILLVPLVVQQVFAEPLEVYISCASRVPDVRHPIYTGLLTAMLGTALADNLLGLIVVAVLTAYFYYSGTVEERNLTATFPQAYPAYKSRTKMLIPFLL